MFKSDDGLDAWPARFWIKVDGAPLSDTECWNWGASLDPKGYGQINIQGRNRRAHRVAYELEVGVIPDGLTLDHLCHNSRCVNPRHLEPVTLRINTLRGNSPAARNAVKTHCVNGHALTGDNVAHRRQRMRWRRVCRRCARGKKYRIERRGIEEE